MDAYRNMAERLRQAGIPVTLQRLEIAHVLLSQPVHLAAEQILARVRETTPETSRATVYNTLKLFREKELVKEVIVDPNRVFYDSNTLPHHHLYDKHTGTLVDIPVDQLKLLNVPALAPGMVLEGVDIIIRVRSAAQPAADGADASD